MNKKLLALYSLKFNPFSPEIPTSALFRAPAIDSFCWRMENQVGEGGFRRRIMYFMTVDLATVTPSLASSPTIRGDPQVGFALDIRRMRSRASFATRGRPGLPLPLSLVQC